MAAPIWVHPIWRTASSAASDTELHGKQLLLVLEGNPGRWRLLKRLTSAGLTFVCYSTKPDPGWAEAYIPMSHWVHGPLGDHTTAINSVQQWLSEHRTTLDGVLCYDEYGVELAAALAHALGLPFMDSEVASALRCKHRFRRACQSAGLPTPGFGYLTRTSTPQAYRLIKDLRFPVVAKPTCCAGSFAVTRCDCMSDLVAAAERLFEQLPRYLTYIGIDPESEAAARWGMVVEEMVEGDEVDIDCVVVRGQLVFAAISDNHPQPPTTDCCAFMERGCRCPSVLPQQEQTALLQLAQSVASLWGDSLSGVIHLEAFSTPQGPVPIELNGRIGGAETYTNILSVWGVDLAVQAARIALGLPLDINITTSHAATASAQHCGDPSTACAAAAHKSICMMHKHAGVQERQLWQEHPSPVIHPTVTEHLLADRVNGQQPHPSHTAVGSADDTPVLIPAAPDLTAQQPRQSTVAPCVSRPVLQRPQTWMVFDIHAVCGPVQATCMHCSTASGSPVSSCEHSPKWDCDAAGVTDAVAGLSVAGDSGGLGRLTSWQCDQTSAGGQPRDAASPIHQPAKQSPTQQLGCNAAAATDGVCASCVPHQPAPDCHCVVLARPRCHVYSVNFVPEWRGEGVVEVLRVEEGVRRDPDCVDAELYFGPGALVKLPPAGYSALGWMAARGHSSHTAETAMTRLMEGVHIRLKPPPLLQAQQPEEGHQ